MSFTINARVTGASYQQTLRSLAEVDVRVARRALRKGVFKAGSATVKQAKAAAPRGRTGQFRRSLAKKDLRYAANATYVSLVGQRKGRQYTARQVESADRKTGRLSKGLSGRGKAPAIHWIESGTSAHRIKAKTGKGLFWNVIRGGVLLKKARHAKVSVRHPGHSGTGFLNRTERQYRSVRVTIVAREISQELSRLRR